MTDVIDNSFEHRKIVQDTHTREIQRIRKLASAVAEQVAKAHIPPSLASVLIGSIPHTIADAAIKTRGNIARACDSIGVDLHEALEDDFRRVWDSYNEYR